MGDIQTLYNQDAITRADLLNERVLPFFCLCPQRIFGGKPHSRPLAYRSRPVGSMPKRRTIVFSGHPTRQAGKKSLLTDPIAAI